MGTQTYANHRRFVPLYHFVLTLLVLLTIGGALVNAYRAYLRDSGRLVAALILLLAVCALLEGAYLRIFALKAQDRAIRAEENLRHFALYGSLLDSRLDTRQIIGLRFASDAEFGPLAQRAAEEKLSEDAIKKAIKEWRADHYRV
jgi:hypothetical protein